MFYSTRNNQVVSRGSRREINTITESNVGASPRDSKLHHASARPRHLRHHTADRAHQCASEPAHSSPIRLPKTHIHRTPSELQLAQELLKADYCEHKMYARLVYGMSHQNEEEMHPLTVKSLRGVVNTHNQDSHRHADHQEDEKEKDDWEMCNQEEIHKDAMIDTRESSSVVSNDEAEEDDDDDFLFNLEM